MAVWNVINHTELSSANATLIDWTSIPASYDHLYGLLSIRSDASAEQQAWKCQLNGVATNFSYTNIYASISGSSVAAEQQTTGAQPTFMAYPRMPADQAGAQNYWGATEFWIPNYANTDTFKTCIVNNGSPSDSNTTGHWYFYTIAGMWAQTAAINQITISTTTGDDFKQYSTATLYGINGYA